ncbi:hypothetical protein EPO33_00395 [Patescibacteria group bacterium]|nr:MAG: hypothetical protein EPO33_00395 [Patescibacteria group bacterium]
MVDTRGVKLPDYEKLFDNGKKFLVSVIPEAKASGDITGSDLYAAFPPKLVFERYAAAQEDERIADVVCGCFSAIGRATAKTLGSAVATQLLEAAVAAQELGKDAIYRYITAQELVRIFEPDKLWGLLEDKKWDEKDTPEHRTLVRACLTAFKEFELGGGPTRTLHAIEDAIGIEAYVEYLPKEVLVEIIRTARGVNDGKGAPDASPLPQGVAFSVDVMALVASTDVLSEHLPIPLLMRPIRAAAQTFGFVKKPEPPAEPASPPASTTLAPTGDPDDDEKVPTTPPPAKKPDGDSDEPIVEIGKGDGAASDPDEDDAALEDLLRGQAEKDKEKKPDGDGPLELDEDDVRTTVGAVPVSPPSGGGKSPPPLPSQRGGQTTGRRSR